MNVFQIRNYQLFSQIGWSVMCLCATKIHKMSNIDLIMCALCTLSIEYTLSESIIRRFRMHENFYLYLFAMFLEIFRNLNAFIVIPEHSEPNGKTKIKVYIINFYVGTHMTIGNLCFVLRNHVHRIILNGLCFIQFLTGAKILLKIEKETIFCAWF